jgi:hypothetical protein
MKLDSNTIVLPSSRKEYHRDYYIQNKDRILDYQRAYNREHQEQRSQYQRDYSKNNRETLNNYKREYYYKIQDKSITYQKNYNNKNKEKIKEYQQEYYLKRKEKKVKKEKPLIPLPKYLLDKIEAVIKKKLKQYTRTLEKEKVVVKPENKYNEKKKMMKYQHSLPQAEPFSEFITTERGFLLKW